MTLEAEAAADYVQTEAPRLIRVAGATAISFARFDGANRALVLQISKKCMTMLGRLL
jgi:hypothetical protein